MPTDVVIEAVRPDVHPVEPSSIHIALLGCGNVGSAITRLLDPSHARATSPRISSALVRRLARDRAVAPHVRLTTDADAVLAGRPRAVVEVLGGVEPARTLVLRALAEGIPVVTANKTLLARHGAELWDAARRARTPLLYEAAVLAGVPFLGTFARRPLARTVTGLTGIANGTSNYILTHCAQRGCALTDALADAQRLGFAEPDPRNDLLGIDAAEKLVVLLRHFAGRSVHPDDIETDGIDRLTAAQTTHAAELGGTIKPLIHADWKSTLEAFVGPAFLDASHVLARVNGVENALLLCADRGRLLFQGPGAGPDVTAATVLDDVHEVIAGTAAEIGEPSSPVRPAQPLTGWLVTVEGRSIPSGTDVADLLGAFGIYVRQSTRRHTNEGWQSRSYLTWPASRAAVHDAARTLTAAAACSVNTVRAPGDAE